MDVRTNVDTAAPAPEDSAAEAGRSGSASLSWRLVESSAGDRLRCVVGWPGQRPPLADVLPLFEQLGLRLDEHRPLGGASPVADEFTFETRVAVDDDVMGLLGEAFLSAWERRTDRDDFSMLAPVVRLRPRQVQLVRVCFAYLRQAGLGASAAYVREILLQHPGFVRAWVDFVETRFDPRSTGVVDAMDALVAAATTSDEDRVLRWFAGFARGIVRTSLFQQADEAHAATIVVKLDPRRLPFLAPSGATVETFVHHPDVEGLHIRYGRTARGGLRWSDRLEDYRTEVLALVRSQQVKNALIVPAGAKGAFVVKLPLAELDPDAAALQLRRCYRLFVRGLLDITDNIVGAQVQHPADTVVLDGDDPYLVVAADKGTAAFSDLANAEAAEVGFWLGDAFASGGSSGYDHKALGVTARGAWMSVRRHFLELGIDADRDEITVAGIGDMSGDVFGNGMLCSPHLRLVAAFDHRHVFLDPDPDPAASFVERQRLAALPRSSWADYDPALLSRGGLVVRRTAPSVAVSPEVRRRLGIEAEVLSTDELVRTILRAPVDLLWNGGIGTYVRASGESDFDAGDRANDPVRVRADELRCRVVAEGGNLGLTQDARIQLSLAGGRVNADFIDNAGGVNTSDREVNLKILLDGAIEAGTLEPAERDPLLAGCADEVVDAVLHDNERQAAAISIAESHGPFLLDRHERVMLNIEQLAGTDRARAGLPSAEEVARRRDQGRGLARPEIAVLLSHAKNVLARELSHSDVPDDVAMDEVLLGYFPATVRERFADEIRNHPLARKIVCTRLANVVIDRLGPGYVYRLEDRTGFPAAQCLRRYFVVRDLLGLEETWQGLDVLPLAATVSVRRAIERAVDHNACWLVRRAERIDPQRARKELGPHVQRWCAYVEASSTPAFLALVADLVSAGAPEVTARRAAAAEWLFPAFDLANAAAETDSDVVDLGTSFFEVRSAVGLDWLAAALPIAPEDSHVAQLAKAALADELCAVQVRLGLDALHAGGAAAWVGANADQLRRIRALADEVAGDVADEVADIAATSLGVQLLRDLVRRA